MRVALILNWICLENHRLIFREEDMAGLLRRRAVALQAVFLMEDVRNWHLQSLMMSHVSCSSYAPEVGRY